MLDDRSIHVQFSKLIKYISCDFLEFDFSHFTPRVTLFFVEERKPNIFGSSPWYFEKDSSSPGMTEKIQIS